LLHHGRVVMSDRPDELFDLLPVIMAAKGRVMIGGLGLGIAALRMAGKKSVKSVDVIEILTMGSLSPSFTDLH